MSTVDAPAKINLFLEVRARRPDGCHDIETVMREISLADRVAVRPARTLRLTCDDPSIPTDDRNPALRAAKLYLRAARIRRGARIHIVKRIPAGSGLGGGSSDAAAVLRAMERIYRAGADLRSIAGRVGGDVAFFLTGGTALCTGRGERVLPIRPHGRPRLALIVPDRENLTADIYRRCRPPKRPRSAIPMLVALGGGDIGAELFNRLQGPATRNPACRAALAWARRVGPALVTGSGSAAFAILDGRPRLPEPPPGARIFRV